MAKHIVGVDDQFALSRRVNPVISVEDLRRQAERLLNVEITVSDAEIARRNNLPLEKVAENKPSLRES